MTTALPRQPLPSLVHTLPNGVRVVAVGMPHLETASVSVFVRTGSRHESRCQNGISHVVEHMAFKGTRERDCQQINLDAERLGAEVNAHTDKDHTAYHLHGLASDTPRFLRMLGDIVLHGTYPNAELERERQVILQEFAEDEDDGLSTAFKMFDRLCFGQHPMAQPVIGTRTNIESFTRDDLIAYVHAQYTGTNVIVAVAGPLNADLVVREAEAAFGAMPAGVPNEIEPPVHLGGVEARRMAGSVQTHVVLGYPIASMRQNYHAGTVAAALFGEGMSSPLLDRIRERLGLVYYAACSADVNDLCGQFVIEASTSPEHLDALGSQMCLLLDAHAQHIDPVGLERARNQIAVRHLRAREQPFRRLEDAAMDLFTFGRMRPPEELTAAVQGVSSEDVRAVFEGMLRRTPAVAIAGKVLKGSYDRFLELAPALP